MKLNLATPVSTPELVAILGSVGAGHLLNGTLYQPIMQTLVAPAQQGEDALALWELTQKVYAAKDGEIELSEKEVTIIKGKLAGIAYPWLKARLLALLG